jgi:HD superfamily phosphohydrolase
MTDGELIQALKKMGSFQHEIATRLKYRNLFKQAYSVSSSDLTEENADLAKKLESIYFRKNKERELEDMFHIPMGHVIIDAPSQELHRAEPRIDKTNIQVVEKNRARTVDYFTPVARAVKSRAVPDWSIMIITDDKYRDLIATKAEKILF